MQLFQSRYCRIIAVGLANSLGDSLRLTVIDAFFRQIVFMGKIRGEPCGDQARKNHKNRQNHFGHRRNQGCSACRTHVAGGHSPLHDKEVRTPVAKRKHKSQAKNHREQIHTHGICVRAATKRLPGAYPSVFTECNAFLGQTESVRVRCQQHEASPLAFPTRLRPACPDRRPAQIPARS